MEVCNPRPVDHPSEKENRGPEAAEATGRGDTLALVVEVNSVASGLGGSPEVLEPL